MGEETSRPETAGAKRATPTTPFDYTETAKFCVLDTSMGRQVFLRVHSWVQLPLEGAST